MPRIIWHATVRRFHIMEVITIRTNPPPNDPWLDWLHRTWIVLRIPIGIGILLGMIVELGLV